MPGLCENCRTTPLDDEGRCVTCDADAEGLKLLTRSGFAEVREMMSLLEAEGLAPEMEKVPPGEAGGEGRSRSGTCTSRPTTCRARRRAPQEGLGRAARRIPSAAAAAARGQEGIDLDAGGEVTCPACGHRFALSAQAPRSARSAASASASPANAAPDEAQSS